MASARILNSSPRPAQAPWAPPGGRRLSWGGVWGAGPWSEGFDPSAAGSQRPPAQHRPGPCGQTPARGALIGPAEPGSPAPAGFCVSPR